MLTFSVTSTLWQFIDDPGLKNDTRNMPVQLPLAHSGWLFKEESEEPDVKPFSAGPKEEDMEVDVPSVKGIPGALTSPPRLLHHLTITAFSFPLRSIGTEQRQTLSSEFTCHCISVHVASTVPF